MSTTALRPEPQDQPLTHREIRTQAFALLERAKQHDGTEMGQFLKQADLEEASNLAWGLYCDKDDESRHKTWYLLGHVLQAEGHLEQALYYADGAIERLPSGQRSEKFVNFRNGIQEAIDEAKPITPTTPVLPALTPDRICPIEEHHRMNGAIGPAGDITPIISTGNPKNFQELPDVFNPFGSSDKHQAANRKSIEDEFGVSPGQATYLETLDV